MLCEDDIVVVFLLLLLVLVSIGLFVVFGTLFVEKLVIMCVDPHPLSAYGLLYEIALIYVQFLQV